MGKGTRIFLADMIVHWWCSWPVVCAEIRMARLQFKKGTLSAEKYEKEINDYIQYSIREQEKLGVDVLVHGEPERTDM